MNIMKVGFNFKKIPYSHGYRHYERKKKYCIKPTSDTVFLLSI